MIDGMIVDSFAGGGGASVGLTLALGRSPDIAINHDADAMAMHEVNHPETLHLSKNIWQVDPLDYVRGRRVALAWFSPDCKHFSKAKGGRPVKRSIRDLAWVVVLWAKRARPAIIMLENVEEFRDWGPLVEVETGAWRPCPDRRGETFARRVAELKRLGYRVEWRELRACDYGAPTIRRRLFLVARCDGAPIVWPEPTHGRPDDPEVLAGRRKPWRTAADIIDWSLPCPSIFDSKEEIFAKYGLRAQRPLAEATLRRIARGVVRYVLEDAAPFIVGVGGRMGQSAPRGVDEPLQTMTTKEDSAIVAPFVSYAQHGGANRSCRAPVHTLAASAKDQNFLIAATLVQTGQGERAGQPPRVPHLDKPIGTQVAAGGRHAVVAAFLAQHNGGMIGHRCADPVSTLSQKGSQQQVVAAHLQTMRGSTRRDQGADEPLATQSAGGNHAALIAAFLTQYYGNGEGWRLDRPGPTDTTHDRSGLVTVEIGGETFAIGDIGMRMLTPRERFRAQGFPDDYVIDRRPDGSRLTETAQGRMCGNSVSPPVAEALVRANVASAARRDLLTGAA